VNIEKLLIALAFAAFPFSQGFAETAEKVVSKYGNIVAKREVPVGGLTAWTVEKAGHQVILYTTAPGEKMAVIAGVVWDPETGNDMATTPLLALNLASSGDAIDQTDPSPVVAMSGSFAGEIPPAMHTVDSLRGVKEGQGGIGDTVYVIIDPRCPYCQMAYQLTRPYVERGHTIKWIPTAALGSAGVPLAATILQEQDSGVLARVLGKHEKIETQPTPEIEKALDLNLAFMHAAFEQNGGRAGVPVAFYIDHRTGRPKMMTGLSDEAVLQDIFGRL